MDVRMPRQRLKLAETDAYDFDVVGESFRQAALDQICGGRDEDGHEQDEPAILWLDDDNPHDPAAVQVRMNGEHVAYLGRDHARAYRARLAELGYPNAVALVAARIVGGWDDGEGNEGEYGVKLSLAWPIEVEQAWEVEETAPTGNAGGGGCLGAIAALLMVGIGLAGGRA